MENLSSYGMEYNMANKGLTGNNESMFEHPHHSQHGDTGHNRTVGDIAIDDPGGMTLDFANGTAWSVNCASFDFSQIHPTTALFQFLVNGLGISIVAVLGIFGNILSAIVLSRPQMKSSVTCLLLGLAFCDTLLISVSILVFSMPYLNDYVQSSFLWKYENIYSRLWVPYLYPVSITAQTGSVYLTLAVTIERYIAVCHSLKARSICTWRRARICVAAVFFFSIVYNLPRWWEVISIPLCEPVRNMTVYINGKSQMRDDATYVTVYINWAYLVVMYLIPFSGLVVFNLAIYRQVSASMVRKANRERQQLSKLQRREMGLATMLLCVVVVFLLCNVLPLVNNILESFYDTSVDQLVAISNFLVVVNSSVNFVIYCTCGERFRRLLLRLCRDFVGCRLGKRSNYRGSLYRKSHYYRDSKNLGANNNLVSVYNHQNVDPGGGGGYDDDLENDGIDGGLTTTATAGADFEEMSMASVANHTCLTTTNAGGNGTVVVDLSSTGHKGQNNNGVLVRGNNFNNRERNKTVPMLHVHHHHNSHHNVHNNHNNHHHQNNHPSRHQHHPYHHPHNGSNGSSAITPNNSHIPTTPVGVVVPTNTVAIATTATINGGSGRAHVTRRVSSPSGPL